MMFKPKVDRKISYPLTTDELQTIVKACQGKTFADRRGEAAVVRLMAESRPLGASRVQCRR